MESRKIAKKIEKNSASWKQKWPFLSGGHRPWAQLNVTGNTPGVIYTLRVTVVITLPMKRAVLYLRVSTIEQTTANQERELREIAGRMGCEIVKVYKDHGISGAKGRDKRPAFDALCRDAAKRQFDMVMAWSVDRLGRSLQDLVGFLSELHALRIRYRHDCPPVTGRGFIHVLAFPRHIISRSSMTINNSRLETKR
jgi:hypothetical protein